MVVEHIFITSYEPEQAMRLVLDFLGPRGFVSPEPLGFRMAGDAWNSLRLRRGGTRATAGVATIDLPQTLAVDYDRGRVIVAAGIDVPKKELTEHSQLLIQLTLALESLLARRLPPDQVAYQLDAIEFELRRKSAAKGRNKVIAWVVVGAIVFLLIVLAIVANLPRR